MRYAIRTLPTTEHANLSSLGVSAGVTVRVGALTVVVVVIVDVVVVDVAVVVVVSVVVVVVDVVVVVVLQNKRHAEYALK